VSKKRERIRLIRASGQRGAVKMLAVAQGPHL